MKQHFLFIASLEAGEAYLLSFEKNLLLGSARRISLEQVRAVQDKDQVIVVLADHLVSNYELTLSARNQVQLGKAARFAVEEKLPGALEDYQIITHKRSKQSVSVRAIQLKRLEGLLAHLATYALKPTAIFVESDLLNRSIPALLLSAQEATLCGDQLEQTYEFDNSLLPMIAARIFSILEQSSDLHIIYPQEQYLLIEALQNQAPETIRIKKILKNEQYYKSLCTNQQAGINLLQGDFSVADEDSKQASLWAYPAWLAAAFAVVFTVGSLAQNLVLEHRISRQESELTQAYSNAFPGARAPRDIVDLGNKLRAKLSSSANPVSDTLLLSPLALLNSTAGAVAKNPVQILGITLDSNTAELLVVGATVETLDRFKNALANEIGTDQTLSMDSVTSKDEQYQGKISIR